MLAGVQVEHELDQRPFQARARSSETNESAPAQLRRPLGVEEFQLRAERDVIQNRVVELRFLAPAAHDWIIRGRRADGRIGVREVRNIEEQITLAFFRRGCLPNELCDLVADLPDMFLQLGGVFAPAAGTANFLAQTFPVGVALLQRRLHFPSLRVDREHFIDLPLIVSTATREPAFHEVGLFTDQTNIEHRQEKDRINRINKIFLIP